MGFNTPIVNENTIHIEVFNENSQKEILNYKEDLLNFMRNSLENNEIQLQVDVKTMEEKPKEEYIFHREDFYREMVKKNPAILELKTTFGLTLRD